MPNQLQAPDKPQQYRVTGKVRLAIEAMVWGALPRRLAAEAAGMREHSLYKAMRTAPAQAAYAAELKVLRTSEKARNVHALLDVRDNSPVSMARVNAVKALELLDDQEDGRSTPQRATPGVVIVIQGGQTRVGGDPVLTQIEAAADLPYGHSDILDESL